MRQMARLLGLPFCCGRTVALDRFEGYVKPGSVDSRNTCNTIFRCGRCAKEGQRHEFDPEAARIDRLLDLPMDPAFRLGQGWKLWRSWK